MIPEQTVPIGWLAGVCIDGFAPSPAAARRIGKIRQRSCRIPDRFRLPLIY